MLTHSHRFANDSGIGELARRINVGDAPGTLSLLQEDRADLQFEELGDEPVCAVARIGHPMQGIPQLGLQDIADAGWILSPQGTILRHRFEMMFRRVGLKPPVNVIDTSAPLIITSLLQQTDFLHVMPVEIARYYAQYGMLTILPVDLPCNMDSFGIITRSNQLQSPGAKILLQAIREAAAEIYTSPPAMA